MEIVIATDLDRTLLPNGKEEYDNSLPLFFEIVKKNKWKLVYVSGRNLSLFEEAKREYNIEYPNYLISEVGTMVYNNKEGKLVLSDFWIEYLKNNKYKHTGNKPQME